jgi:hypothetical protein
MLHMEPRRMPSSCEIVSVILERMLDGSPLPAECGRVDHVGVEDIEDDTLD